MAVGAGMSCARGKYGRQIGLGTPHVVAQERDLMGSAPWCALTLRESPSSCISTPIFSFVPIRWALFFAALPIMHSFR